MSTYLQASDHLTQKKLCDLRAAQMYCVVRYMNMEMGEMDIECSL